MRLQGVSHCWSLTVQLADEVWEAVGSYQALLEYQTLHRVFACMRLFHVCTGTYRVNICTRSVILRVSLAVRMNLHVQTPSLSNSVLQRNQRSVYVFRGPADVGQQDLSEDSTLTACTYMLRDSAGVVALVLQEDTWPVVPAGAWRSATS